MGDISPNTRRVETALVSKDAQGAIGPMAEQEYERVLASLVLRRFQLLAGPGCEKLAQGMAQSCPDRYTYHETSWDKFPDGTDSIQIGGFQPCNVIGGSHVVFLCSFHNNDVTLSQLSVMIVLLESFVESLTIVLPFYPVGTMERVTVEGQVATGSTYARMLSHLPLAARPTRLMLYDVHTLQNRFYLSTGVIASLCTTVPTVLPMLHEAGINCIAFPDDGAAKRFGTMFEGFPLVTCGKTRQGDCRHVYIQSGDCHEMDACIVDDLVQTGGTLFEAGKALRDAGAKSVSAFVAHAVFPGEGWKRFLKGGDRAIFQKFFLTNSNPTRVAKIPEDDVFVIVDITERILHDIDRF